MAHLLECELAWEEASPRSEEKTSFQLSVLSTVMTSLQDFSNDGVKVTLAVEKSEI
jgi:hypothetical protein